MAPNGDFWVADRGNHRIHHFDHGGKPLRVIGFRGKIEGQLENPSGAVHVEMCMHAYMYICVYVYMHKCIYAYMHIHMWICIYRLYVESGGKPLRVLGCLGKI